MERDLTDGIFDDVQEFPDADVKRRYDRLVGLDAALSNNSFKTSVQ